MKKENNLPEGITPEQVAAWKEKHGENKVKTIKLFTDEKETEQITAIGVVPGRRTLSMYEKFSDSDPGKAKDILISNCMLTHLEQIKASDYMFFSCVKALAQLIPIGEAEVGNL